MDSVHPTFFVVFFFWKVLWFSFTMTTSVEGEECVQDEYRMEVSSRIQYPRGRERREKEGRGGEGWLRKRRREGGERLGVGKVGRWRPSKEQAEEEAPEEQPNPLSVRYY